MIFKLPFLLVFVSLFLSSTLALRSLDERDPRCERHVRDCQQRCSSQCGQEPYREQQRCRERCSERCQDEYRGGCGRRYDHEYDDDGEDRVIELNPEDPRQEMLRRTCRQRCQQQERGTTGQRSCQERCEKQYMEREKQRGSRWEEEEDRDDDPQEAEGVNPRYDPEERYETCQRRCLQRQGGQAEQGRCQRRCKEEYEREEERGRGRRRHGAFDDDEEGDIPGGRDPEERMLEECQERCQRQGGRQKWQCQRRCRDQYEREREQGPSRRLDDDDEEQEEEEMEISSTANDKNNPRRGPRQEFHECQRRCGRQEQGRRQQRRCQQRCQEQMEAEEMTTTTKISDNHRATTALATILDLAALFK